MDTYNYIGMDINKIPPQDSQKRAFTFSRPHQNNSKKGCWKWQGISLS